MKKLILLISLFCVNGLLKAQETEKILKGVKAGYNLTFSTYKSASKLDTKPFHGGYLGAMMKIPFDNHLFFVPQVDFSYRGMATDSLKPNEFSSIKEVHLRVQPLLQIDFKHPKEHSNTFFLQFGPSIGFGMLGRQVKQDWGNVPADQKLKYGFQAYGKYDAHWHTGLGYENTSGLRVLLEYAHGLGNMINTDDGPSLKYRTVSLGIGYWFGKQ